MGVTDKAIDTADGSGLLSEFVTVMVIPVEALPSAATTVSSAFSGNRIGAFGTTLAASGGGQNKGQCEPT